MSTNEQFKTWCRRLKASDQDAYRQVFRALHDALLRYALYITGDTAAACDIVQDTFLQLWEMRETLDARQSLEALLYRMVQNRAYNHQRDRRTHAAKRAMIAREHAFQHQNTSDADDGLNGTLLRSQLRRWIDDLPERQREALLLSRFEGLSHEEIAVVMDISPHTVNTHVVRALKTLRERTRTFEPDLLAP